MTPEDAVIFGEAFEKLVANVERAIVGKTHTVRLALTALLSDGHLLLEDNPGTGKTLLAKAIANTVQGTQKRIQFTPDLLPSDITGVAIFDQRTGEFRFRQGPIFATIVLADEINRASPKTQSALLEVMEDEVVTVDGEAHDVGTPFMVIATMNPIEHAGTYRLPEAQLDRFMMKTKLGYLDHESSVALLADSASRHRSNSVPPLIATRAVNEMIAMAATVHVDPVVISYIVRLAEATRRAPEVRLGVSQRGCEACMRAVKTWAASKGRHYVLPDDVRELAEPLMAHRILLHPEAEFGGSDVYGVLSRIVADVEPPVERAA